MSECPCVVCWGCLTFTGVHSRVVNACSQTMVNNISVPRNINGKRWNFWCKIFHCCYQGYSEQIASDLRMKHETPLMTLMLLLCRFWLQIMSQMKDSSTHPGVVVVISRVILTPKQCTCALVYELRVFVFMSRDILGEYF